MAAPKITLYTNHGCPYAHRAHIALRESGLEYEEVLIDLDKPREPWYLKVNPVRAHQTLLPREHWKANESTARSCPSLEVLGRHSQR
jgi:glutathione S-transferase